MTAVVVGLLVALVLPVAVLDTKGWLGAAEEEVVALADTVAAVTVGCALPLLLAVPETVETALALPLAEPLADGWLELLPEEVMEAEGVAAPVPDTEAVAEELLLGV